MWNVQSTVSFLSGTYPVLGTIQMNFDNGGKIDKKDFSLLKEDETVC
jgi:hypothetical protein